MLTVGELISELGELDSSLPVLSSQDDEGNAFNHVYRVYTGYLTDDITAWQPDLMHEDDIEEDEDYAEYTTFQTRVVVLG